MHLPSSIGRTSWRRSRDGMGSCGSCPTIACPPTCEPPEMRHNTGWPNRSAFATSSAIVSRSAATRRCDAPSSGKRPIRPSRSTSLNSITPPRTRPSGIDHSVIRRATYAGLLVIGLTRRAAADEVTEVVVRGEPIGAPPKEPSVAGSVIQEDRLRAPGLKASDVLRTQPGVAVHETGGYGSLSTAMIRGATAAQTPIYLAGIRLNDDVGGTADLSLIPLWLVRRVEIYRSHAPLAGDQLGIGGAIFFEPRRPKKTEVGAGAMVGSFGARALWAEGAVGDDEACVLVGARGEAARNDYGFVNDWGARFEPGQFRPDRRTNADAQTIDVWAMGSLRLGEKGRADFIANDVERELGLPGLIFPNTAARASLQRRLAGLTAQVPCANGGCELVTTSSAVVSHVA